MNTANEILLSHYNHLVWKEWTVKILTTHIFYNSLQFCLLHWNLLYMNVSQLKVT